MSPPLVPTLPHFPPTAQPTPFPRRGIKMQMPKRSRDEDVGGAGRRTNVKREAADCATLELRSARVLNCKCVNCQLCGVPQAPGPPPHSFATPPFWVRKSEWERK